MNTSLKRIQELNQDLYIREARPSDVFGFTRLMSSYYSRKNNEKYFTWRFFACPSPSTLYVVTTKENLIVGAYGVNIFMLTNGKLCGLTLDLIISDAYRHRGLLFLLEDKINKFTKKHNCSYLLCFPNDIGMKAHTKIERWKMVRTIPILVFSLTTMKAKQGQISKVVSDKEQVSFEYSRQLLKWRFEENPEYKYQHIKSGKCQSYIKFFSDTVKNITVGDIVYYNFSTYSKSTFQTLINTSIKKLQSRSVHKIITWCSDNSPLYPIFLSLGFVPQIQPRYLCIKPLLPNATDPKLLNWQILPGDSEVF